MRNLYLFIALILFTHLYSWGQVGINTTSPNALLDITTEDSSAPLVTDGLLIPRLNVFPSTNPSGAQHSMQVYLTGNLTGVNINGTAKNYDTGFYYWDNTQTDWILIKGNDWKITGNENTTRGINFVGTTDAAELDFRVNNKIVGRLTELGQLELEAEGESILIGTMAGENQDLSTGGELNTYIGYHAGMNGTSANNNVAIGHSSLSSITKGKGNFSIGNNTLSSLTTLYNNISIGNNNLSQFNDGEENITIGNNLLTNATGYVGNNIIMGYGGSNSWTSCDDNVIIGIHFDADADLANSTGIGYGTTLRGDNASSFGYFASSGPSSISIGAYSSAVGSRSVTIGSFASTGLYERSLALGYGAKVNANWSTAIGANAIVNDPDAIVIGDSTPISIGGYVGWSTLSDGRFKYDIKEDVPGIDFVTQLRPVTYKVDRHKLNEFIGAEALPESKNRLLNRVETGFIAQEVEAIASGMNYNFNGIVAPDDLNKSHYKISYSSFVVPLVKATQEQQIAIERLSKELKEEKERNKSLEKRLERMEKLFEKKLKKN